MNHDVLALLAPLAAGFVAFLCGLAAYVFDAEENPELTMRFRLPGSQIVAPKTQPQRRRTSLFFFLAGCVASGSAPFLYFKSHPAAFSVPGVYLNWGGGIVCAAVYFFLIGLLLASRQTRGRNERRENVELAFKMIESVVLILGVAFAIHAAATAIESLNKNAENNRTLARAQLYEADNKISEEERRASATKLESLYANPHPVCKTDNEAKAYVEDALKMITSDPQIYRVGSARDLYWKAFGKDTFSPPGTPERPDVAELRQMVLHCTLILNMLHAGFDDIGDIMDREEYETWAGYFNDIGPHPILLATLWLWSERGYMSKEFAAEVHEKLFVQADESQKRVIRVFFTELSKPSFGDRLHGGYTRPTNE